MKLFLSVLFTLSLLLSISFADDFGKNGTPEKETPKRAGIALQKHVKPQDVREKQAIVTRDDLQNKISEKIVSREEFRKRVSDNGKKKPIVDRENRKVQKADSATFGTKTSALTSGNPNPGPVTSERHESDGEGCGSGTYNTYQCSQSDCSCNWESRKDRRAGFYWGCYDWTWGYFDPGVCYDLRSYTGFYLDFYDYGTISYDWYNGGMEEYPGWEYEWRVDYCECYYDGYDSAYYNGYIDEWEFNSNTGQYQLAGVMYCSDLEPFLY